MHFPEGRGFFSLYPPLFCYIIFLFFATANIHGDSLDSTLHYITFLTLSLRATITRITHFIYTLITLALKFCGEDMVLKGNWLVLAGTGTDGLVLMEGMGRELAG